MGNLLLYVEENLILTPELCYKEETIFNGDNKTSFETDTNVPLVSPQSTLDDKLFQPSSESILFSEQKMLPAEENMQDQISQNESISPIFISSKKNTNPFLEDEIIYDQFNDDISPQRFMQLWSENLQIQRQITATLNILLNRVLGDSAKNRNGSLTSDENTLNMIKNALLQVNEQIPTFVHPTSTNVTDTSKNTISSIENISGGKNISINVGYPVEHSTFSVTNQEPVFTTLHNGNKDLNTCIYPFQDNSTLDAIRNPTSTNSNFLMSTNNDFDTANQGFEKLSNKFNINLQNHFSNDINTDHLAPEKNPTNDKMSLKETNPFRLSLADKLRISDSEEETCSRFDDLLNASHKYHESVVEYDLINFENNNSQIKYTSQNILDDCKNTSFDHYQYFVSDSSNNKSDVVNNSFVSNARSLNHNWNVDDATNTMSKITIDNPSTQYNIHKKEMGKHCFSPSNEFLSNHDLQSVEKPYNQERIHTTDVSNQSSCIQNSNFGVSKEISNCKAIDENFTFPSNYNFNDCGSFTLLSPNGLECSTLGNTANIDEGYLTRSSTSHTLYNSSPVMELTNKAQYDKKSIIKNFDELSGDPEEVQSKILKSWSKIYCMSENNDERITFNKDKQQNSVENSDVENALNFQVYVDNIGTKSLCSKKSKIQTIEKDTCISKHFPLNSKVFFQVVDLPKRIVHIFHHKGEGWLLINEFVEAFTEFETTLYMVNFLHSLNIRVQFEEIDRAKNSIEFVRTNSILSKATHDIINNTDKLHLLPLNLAFKILHKLEIIFKKDITDVLIYEKFVNDSIVHEIWLIINAYRLFKYSIESGQ